MKALMSIVVKDGAFKLVLEYIERSLSGQGPGELGAHCDVATKLVTVLDWQVPVPVV